MEIELATTTVLAFLISVLACPLFIKYLNQVSYQQQIRVDGPQTHLSKQGTPTMGGVVFVAAALISTLWLAPFEVELMLALMVLLVCGFLGGIDDYSKIARSRSLGLKARSKLLVQAGLTLLLMYFLNLVDHPTEVVIPFTEFGVELGSFYGILVFLMISGTTNAVNLTDGVDGLAGGSGVVALGAFMFLAIQGNEWGVALFCGGLIGGILGFLFYNFHPAKIFMGDVGSLALGGGLAAVAILLNMELLLVMVGGLFVL